MSKNRGEIKMDLNIKLDTRSDKRLQSLIRSSKLILSNTLRKYPDHIWEIGFSGGKDSTVVLHIVVEFLANRIKKGLKTPRKVLVVYGDTLLDIPLIRLNALKILEDLKRFSKKKLNDIVDVVIVRPNDGKDFFSMMIEKGYPPPHYRFRWCVRTLKIEPAINFINSVDTNFIMISGIRNDESSSRSKNIKNRRNNSSRHIMISPIAKWKKDDIFQFLLTRTQPWNGEPYNNLLKAYLLESDLICTICSLSPNVRYGCWTCTVIKKDRALEALSRIDQKWKIIHETKELIRKVPKIKKLREYKNGVPRKLNKLGRLVVIAIIIKAIKYCPDSMAGYIDDPNLRRKIEKWIRRLLESKDEYPLRFAGITLDDINFVLDTFYHYSMERS